MNSVFLPRATIPLPEANPLPGVVGATLLPGEQSVRIVLIIGSSFKDVDIFE
jgi:hypothetical protein